MMKAILTDGAMLVKSNRLHLNSTREILSAAFRSICRAVKTSAYLSESNVKYEFYSADRTRIVDKRLHPGNEGRMMCAL